MAHKTLIGGTTYEISGGKTLIDGTGYSINVGKILVDGTEYDVPFTQTWKKYTVATEKTYEIQKESLKKGYEISISTHLLYYSSSAIGPQYYSNGWYFYVTNLKAAAGDSSGVASARIIVTPYNSNGRYKSIYRCTSGFTLLDYGAGVSLNGAGTFETVVDITKDVQGDYIEDVVAAAGTYPENGVQDGYWYVLQDS